jgi:hypothetical protein
MSHSPWAGLKVPSTELLKLNWTIKKCMGKANSPTWSGQRDTVSLYELFLCIFRPNLMENYLVPQILRTVGLNYFRMGDLPYFIFLQSQIN